MTEIQQEEKQQELFLEFQGAAKRPERFPALAKAYKPILLSTTIEQIILVGIVLILAGCLTFFLGVLRGKALTARAPRYLTQRRISAASAVPQNVAVAPKAAVKPEDRTIAAGSDKKVQQAQDAAKPYTIQLSTYKKQDLAEKEAVMLRRSGFYSTIISSGGYYVVCVGQYMTKDAAKKDLKIFSARYQGCFLRRRF